MAVMMAIMAMMMAMRSDGVEDCDAALSPWRLEQEFEVLSSQGREYMCCGEEDRRGTVWLMQVNHIRRIR